MKKKKKEEEEEPSGHASRERKEEEVAASSLGPKATLPLLLSSLSPSPLSLPVIQAA